MKSAPNVVCPLLYIFCALLSNTSEDIYDVGILRRAASNQMLARLLDPGLAKAEQFIFEALHMGLRLTMTMKENSLLGAQYFNNMTAD